MTELAHKAADGSYTARVTDNGIFEVDLDYDEEIGWDGFCTCSQELDCAHVYAAMSAFMAEHNASLVRRLSSGQLKTSGSSPQGSRSAPKAPEDIDLARRLTTAVGRPLNRKETQFLGTVRWIYGRCSQVQGITYWDLQKLGFPLTGNSWHNLQIWPTFPDNEVDFWLYTANFAREHGIAIPPFMEPVSDLEPVRNRLARWRREQDIEQWKLKLTNLRAVDGIQNPAGAAGQEVDLRMVVSEAEIYFQWRRTGAVEFDRLRQTHLRQLTQDLEYGRALLTPEATLLWQFFQQSAAYGGRVEFRYLDTSATRLLGQVLRLPLLESRILGSGFQPLIRRTDPLRWEVIPAEGPEDDYRLRLVQADGTPPPPILAALPGHPSLYLAAKAVFPGPAPQPHLLAIKEENRIPAPVIEKPVGVEFLEALGVELPARLRERVRRQPSQVAIRCRLLPRPAGGRTEECLVEVHASTPDGMTQVWTGHNWLDTTPRTTRKATAESDIIEISDTALRDRVPALLEPLNLRQNNYGHGQVLKVTRQFPAVFSAFLKTVPPPIEVLLDGELASLANAEVAGRVKLDVTEAEIDWFDLRVVLDVSDTTLTKDEIKLLLNAKGEYVRLAGKGWRRLRYDLSEDENERLARLGLNPGELSAEPQRLHALQLADEAAKKFLPEEQVERIQRRASEIKARVAPDLPAGITAQLRPYQLEGFHFLAYLSVNRFGGILADDMGLGKTLQTLAWLLWLRQQPAAANPKSEAPLVAPQPTEAGSPKHKETAKNGGNEADGKAVAAPDGIAPSLVVCPKSVMDNWQAEAARFAPGLRVRLWSADELGNLPAELASADLHVVNYSQLRLANTVMRSVRWQAAILDEGQYIKNPSSLTAQVAKALRAEHRLILSGTPIENRLMDLWSLISYAMPGVLGTRAHFGKIYNAKGDPFARRRLAARVRPFVLRRTKTQVAKDLPDRIEEDILCEIEGEQKVLYRAELKRAQQLLLGIQTQKELAKFQFHFLTSLLRLRQICCDPRLIAANSKAPSAKLDALLEQLEPLMEEGEKVLVFSQFVEMLNLLQKAIADRGWPSFFLAGDTENRGDLVRKFQTAEGPAVFLISLKAGGFGLNLTAANYVVLFDPWWNPAVENQAIDRTHRIGQTDKVIAYRLLIKNSIEEKIRALQKQKKALADDVLGEEKFAQSLTIDDLRFLFAD